MKFTLEDGSYFLTEEKKDCSIPLSNTPNNPRAWYVDFPVFEPVRTEHWTGSVAEGGSVNFRNIFFNPHGHGTHTECCGHITRDVYSVQPALENQFLHALLVSIEPASVDADLVITAQQLAHVLKGRKPEALLIRTLPNSKQKMSMNYSSTNPAYFHVDGVQVLNEAGVRHLLTDLPSVDREEDGGDLVFHHAYWNVPEQPDTLRTITELAFFPNEAPDGEYILSLTGATFVNDATPSRPIIYPLHRPTEVNF